ncbi:plasmid mobilization protein [Paraburkholderia sp. BCC1885]|uniref:plasmid mobilization protein n=1 Tax=Paraburkholderia sp. BCC1885 TaxID=2562669 RepID=UPI00164344C2|nr:hypothetical protein [Paraburkholderia sp. BCC1885]
MNKPSERIVVFVTPAQKLAIAASAETLGISVSELMRRAVLSFGATSEQVKAASIVDRLRAPREPDALNQALERVARGSRDARAAQPAALQKAAPATAAGVPQQAEHETLLPADVLAALVRTPEEEQAAEDQRAVARVAAAKAAAIAPHAEPEAPRVVAPIAPIAPVAPVAPATPAAPRRRVRLDATPAEDDPRNDPSTEDGRFA